MNKKIKVLLIAAIATLMLIAVKSNAQDFRMGVFQKHVSLRMDNSIDQILKQTSYIQWTADESLLKHDYGFEYDFKSNNNKYQFEFLSKKEFKKFNNKGAEITISFLDKNLSTIYKVSVSSQKTKDINTGKADYNYLFLYNDAKALSLHAVAAE